MSMKHHMTHCINLCQLGSQGEQPQHTTTLSAADAGCSVWHAAFIRDAAALKLKLYAGDSIMDPDLFKALGANAATLVGAMRGTGFTLGELVGG
jgi:hypothetical protein